MYYIPSKIWKLLSSDLNAYINKTLEISSASLTITEETKDEFKNIFQRFTEKRQKLNDKYEEEEEEAVIETNEKMMEISKEAQQEDMIETISREKVNIENNSNGLRQRVKSSINDATKKFDQSLMKNKVRLVSALKPIKAVKGLAIKYLMLKLFNLANAIVQLFILNNIFEGRFLSYGYTYFMKLAHGKSPLLMTSAFPIYTLCDFFVYEPNRKIHEYSVQCILPMNVLLEKFYIIIWFWLVILSILTLVNLVSWFYEIFFTSTAKFLFKYFEIQKNIYKNNKKFIKLVYDTDENEIENFEMQLENKQEINEIRKFQDKYLGKDGLVMLLIIKSVIGNITFIKLFRILYQDYNQSYQIKSLK